MVFDLNQFVKSKMMPQQLNILQDIVNELNNLIPNLNLAIPRIQVQIDLLVPKVDKLTEIFNYVNNFVQALEKEIEGLKGDVFRQIDDIELQKLALGTSDIIVNFISNAGDVSTLASFPAFPEFFGTSVGFNVNNEKDGINDFFAANTDQQKQAAIDKMIAGLNLQKNNLELLATTYNMDVSLALNDVNAALDNAQRGPSGIDTAFLQQRLININARVDVNTQERTAQYPVRHNWLKAVVSGSVGVLSKKLKLDQVKKFTEAEKQTVQDVNNVINNILV